MIREANQTDAGAIAAVHVRSFPGYFLSGLGRSFLEQFYLGLIDCPVGVVLVHASGVEVEGFAAGATNRSEAYHWLLSNRKWPLAWSAAPSLMRHPANARLLAANLKGERGGEQVASAAWLMSIAVAPDRQDSGLGADLLHNFAAALTSRRVERYFLETDAYDNEQGNRFYTRQSLLLVGASKRRDGRLMNRYASYLD